METINPFTEYKIRYCDNCHRRNKCILSIDVKDSVNDLEEQETIFRCAKMREL